MDAYLFNGGIERGADFKFIQTVAQNKKSDHCTVLMVTNGGNPDAAYKMARYLQHKYESYSVLVSGACKSAGTLFSIGANEVVFAPYGELGPLDIQLTKTDHLAGMESGLNISEAFNALEERARETFVTLTLEIIGSSGGVVSFQTASHSASEIVGSLYGPVFARIDPEEVGSRSRAMRIGEDYGKRLNLKWNNLKPNALGLLSQTYSSHAFVIDFLEAESLYYRTRLVSDDEMRLIDSLGDLARHPQRNLTILALHTTDAAPEDVGHDETTGNDHEQQTESDRNNGFDSEAAVGTQGSEAG
jgi:hypothetical protein